MRRLPRSSWARSWRADPLFRSAAVTAWTLEQGLSEQTSMTFYRISIVTSFPDPEEHDVPFPESLSSCDASRDAPRLSCFVSSLESKQNLIFYSWRNTSADLKSLTRIAISRISFFSSSWSSLRSKLSSILVSSCSLSYIHWSLTPLLLSSSHLDPLLSLPHLLLVLLPLLDLLPILTEVIRALESRSRLTRVIRVLSRSRRIRSWEEPS